MCTFVLIMKTTISASERAIKKIKSKGGLIRTKEAISSGIYPRTLNELVKDRKLEIVSRGIYRYGTSTQISDPDLVIVATRIPHGVICLISALSYHKITTQIPHKVYVALKRDARTPRLDFPPVAIQRFSGKAFLEGIEKHNIDGVEVKIYNAEKTLADCFKFRNKIGMDVVLEAMKIYKSKMKFNIRAIMHYSRICRVDKIITPYLEAIG